MELIRVLAERPVINFASGLPDPACFPATALREAAAASGVPVLADEAYLHLRYDPGGPGPRAAAAPEAPILTVGTFSKVIARGLRVAWIGGPSLRW